MNKLVLVRHGESIWNLENRFTGWTDVELSKNGIGEAESAGDILKTEGYVFDIAYTSYLKRAIHTLWKVLDRLDLNWIPVFKTWHLNERHYGALQGLNKAETTEEYGIEQVNLWRRGYEVRPPKLDINDDRYPGKELKYKKLPKEELPLTECLKDTVDRFLPYCHNEIFPKIKSGEKVLICAHGNTLRALVKYLDNISDEDISSLNIPTGIPLVYELDDNLKPIKHYYLGDAEKIRKATESVKNQTGKLNK